MQLHPLEHIRRAGVDGTGRPQRRADALGLVLGRHLVEGNVLNAVQTFVGVSTVIRLGMVFVRLNILDKGAGTGHAQGAKDVFVQALLKALACDALHDIACQNEALVVVLELAADGLVGLQIAQVMHQLFLGEVRAVPAVFVTRHTGAVAQQVAQGDVFRREIVVETNVRNIVFDGSIPIQLSRVHHSRDQRRGEGLGTAANLVERLARGREIVLHIALTEALAEHDLAILDHAHGDRGAIPKL